MTPAALAAIHMACFVTPRPWTAAEFADLLRNPKVFLCRESDGFVLGRVVLDEAELLTLAVSPQMRRQGVGQRLVAAFLQKAGTAGARQAFLEVSVENDAATRLYLAAGFSEHGRRNGYFRTPEGRQVDALVLCRDLA
jgi:[ribosomal protein S18]-alanine N-acetyltransferase